MPDMEPIEMAREAAATVHPYSHNSALILDGERDGTDIVQSALAMYTARQPEIDALKAAVAELVEGLEKVFADPMSLVHSTKAMDEMGDLIAKHGSAKP